MADAFAPHLLGRLYNLARTPEQHAAMVALAASSRLSDATTPEAQLLHLAGYIGAVHPDAAGGDHMALHTREVGAALARVVAAGALTTAQTHRWLTGAHVLTEHVATHDRAPTKAELHASIKKLTAAARLPG